MCTTQCSRPIVAHTSHAMSLAPLCLLGTTRCPCTTSATLGGVQAQDTSHRYVQAAHLTCSLPCMPFKPLHNRMIKFVWLPVNIAPSLLCPAAACVQVVWKSTTNVGCAVRKCNTMAGMSATWNNAYFTVCRYRCVIMGIEGSHQCFCNAHALLCQAAKALETLHSLAHHSTAGTWQHRQPDHLLNTN